MTQQNESTGMNSPSIYFYIPQVGDTIRGSINKERDVYWSEGNMPKTLEAFYSQPTSRTCLSSWILQTYLRLKEDGLPCELIERMPVEGIAIAFCDSLPNRRPGPKLLIVSVKADRDYLHPYAQFHVLQNPQETMMHRRLFDRLLFPCAVYHYMPHWPQPGLIPRDPGRGKRFENVAYFGLEANLAPELRTLNWQKQINDMGLKWHIVSSEEHWNDYSEVDVVVAVRSFINPKKQKIWKPASKLYNAWIAGVPAIMGCESAFRSERKSKLDYIEATSPHDVILALKQLRDDYELRQAMVENGRARAEETRPEALVNRWRNFLSEVVAPAYEHWCMSPNWKRQAFCVQGYLSFLRRYLAITFQSIRNHIRFRTRIRSLTSVLRKGFNLR